jgi:hypothetical protein
MSGWAMPQNTALGVGLSSSGTVPVKSLVRRGWAICLALSGMPRMVAK